MGLVIIKPVGPATFVNAHTQNLPCRGITGAARSVFKKSRRG